MATHKLTLTLPDEVLEELSRYKDMTHSKSKSEVAVRLIKYALTLPQYFRDFDWEKAEEEADREIAAGKVRPFDSVEELLTDLKK